MEHASVVERAIDPDAYRSWLVSATDFVSLGRLLIERSHFSGADAANSARLLSQFDDLASAINRLNSEVLRRQSQTLIRERRWGMALEASLGLTLVGCVIYALRARKRRALPQGNDLNSSPEHVLLALVPRYTSYPVMLTDRNRRVVWVNDAFCRVTEYTAQEVLGRRPVDLIQFDGTAPETISAIRDALDRE